MRPALLAILVAIPLAGQVCEPRLEVRKALGGAQTAEAVRADFPADYFANAFYQDAAGSPAPAAIQEEYRALRDKHPDDSVYGALYARALIGAQTKQAIPLLEQAAFPPALVELARIHSSQTFYDENKLRADVTAYEKVCPASPAIYAHVGRIAGEAFSREHAPKLRKLLEGRTDAESLHLYNLLWTMEFKSVPLPEQEPVRQRVREDAVRLRAMGADNAAAMKALTHAYQILGDADGKKWIEEHAPRAIPSAAIDANRAINKWEQANCPPTQAPSQECLRKQLSQSEVWIRQWPNEPEPRRKRFEALAELPDAAKDEIAHAGDELIRLHEQRGPEGYPPYPPYLEAAKVYAAKGIHPEQLRDLIEKGVREVLKVVDATPSDLDFNPDPTGLYGLNSKWNTLNSAADLDIQLRRYDQAHDMLAEFSKSMEGKDPGVFEYRYWYDMSMLARAENHMLDALTYERNAIAANVRDAGMPDNRAERISRLEEVRAERTAEALGMWKTLGGSEKAFQEWLKPPLFASPAPVERPTTIAAADPWKTIGKPLPDFMIVDAQGKTWHMADLKGKVTLVNLWATWCAPCRDELPYVQKLYDQVRASADFAVITLNMDDNTGLIAPFMKQSGYTFPALPALEYEREFGLGLGLPRTWIVNAEGTLVQQRLGAGLSDRWVDDMLALMQKARAPR
jgi:thiol-disulfide isomerase/thioredoxin